MNKNIADYVISYPDFPKKGVMFRDIFPLIAEVSIFSKSIKELTKQSNYLNSDKILSIEARGFIVGTAASIIKNIPMIPARKFGKLPGETYSCKFKSEYGVDYLQIPKSAISINEKILVADDVLATGGTAKAAIELVKMAGGIPVGIISLIELNFLNGRKLLESNGLKVFSLLNYND